MTWWAGYGWGVVSGLVAAGVVLGCRYHVVRRLSRAELDDLAYGPVIREALREDADSYFDRRETPW